MSALRRFSYSLLSSYAELNSVSHLFPAFPFLGHPLRANSCAAAASRLLLSRFRTKNVGFPPRMHPLALGAVAPPFGRLMTLSQKYVKHNMSYPYFQLYRASILS